ncbi:MAG: hypothetical protein JNL38_29190, partial [Myxococcales bacterium]|nr:hypothetical protein [Myxococcales bacterium]
VGEVAAGEVAAGKVAAGKVAARAVTVGEVAVRVVAAREASAGEIAAGEVAVGEVAAGEVAAGEVAARAVTVREVAGGSVARAVALFAVAAAIGACAATEAAPREAPPGAASPSPVDDAGAPTEPGAADAADAASDACAGQKPRCVAHDARGACRVEPDGSAGWRREPCAVGCYAGACSVTQCADECAAGAACGAWDVVRRAFVDLAPETSLHDRARDYEARARGASSAHGYVVNVRYTDATRATVSALTGYRDAAIWTGSALAAEAWRLDVTGAPDADELVSRRVQTLHRGFAVTQEPGYFARYVEPSSSTAPLSPAKACASLDWHCNVATPDGPVDWIGGTSRDQYTGVVLGYHAAYEASRDPATRALVRADVVAMAVELMKSRKVPIRVVVDGIPIQRTVDLENVILVPSEMVDGRVVFDLATSDPAESGATGMREFFPDFSVLTKQVLGASQPVPRPSSAIMLSAIFELARRVSADDPSLAATHAAIVAYQAAKQPSWSSIASTWTFSTRDGCGAGYFSTHIAYISAFVWRSLALARGASGVPDVVGAAMWPALARHKNP